MARHRDSRRHTAWIAAACAAYLVLFAAAPGRAAGAGEGGAAPSRITLDYLEGTVTVDGAAASVGQAVKPKALIVTGPASLCQILFDGKNIVHIGEDTAVELDFSSLRKTMNLKSGYIAGALKKLAKLSAPGDYGMTVRTGTTVAGVRGTAFFMKVEDPSRTYTCTCNGILHLEDPTAGNAQTVEAAHHKAYRYASSDGKVVVGEADLLYHTDRMMELGAARIGSTIDWTRVVSE